jgi:signal transduction histidine kinase
VAHEVGNPLSGILGYLSLMRTRSAGGPDAGELIAHIEGEVQRIDSIVRSLLELGRPSRGKPGPVELGPLLESSARLLVSSPELRGVEVRQAVPPGLCALAEPGPLSQVVINLILNGAQAMGGKGVLELAARTADDGVELSVRDHGPGLPPEVLARLFEPFFTTRAAGQGTGLGLAVSRHLIEAMGGQLLAANHPEGGALFTVKLPPLPKPAVTQ